VPRAGHSSERRIVVTQTKSDVHGDGRRTGPSSRIESRSRSTWDEGTPQRRKHTTTFHAQGDHQQPDAVGRDRSRTLPKLDGSSLRRRSSDDGLSEGIERDRDRSLRGDHPSHSDSFGRVTRRAVGAPRSQVEMDTSPPSLPLPRSGSPAPTNPGLRHHPITGGGPRRHPRRDGRLAKEGGSKGAIRDLQKRDGQQGDPGRRCPPSSLTRLGTRSAWQPRTQTLRQTVGGRCTLPSALRPRGRARTVEGRRPARGARRRAQVAAHKNPGDDRLLRRAG